jgi:hypothetical protein
MMGTNKGIYKETESIWDRYLVVVVCTGMNILSFM